MPINNNQAHTARQELTVFLAETLGFLRNLCLENNDVFLEMFREKIRNAWLEFEGDFVWSEAEEIINNLSDDKLEKHGLYGNQLDLKLSAVGFWREGFDRLRERFNLREITKELLLEWLKWLIDAIDTVLESFLEITGISGAIKEIKDCLRTLLDLPILNIIDES